MHVGIIPFIIGLIYKSKWYYLFGNVTMTKISQLMYLACIFSDSWSQNPTAHWPFHAFTLMWE